MSAAESLSAIVRRVIGGHALRLVRLVQSGNSFKAEELGQICDAMRDEVLLQLRIACAADREAMRKALMGAVDQMVDLQNKHLSHTSAVVRALLQKRIEECQRAMSLFDGVEVLPQEIIAEVRIALAGAIQDMPDGPRKEACVRMHVALVELNAGGGE